MTANDPGTVAHGIMDANLYMVLATADATGRSRRPRRRIRATSRRGPR
jgi:hypothetical protein